MPHLDHALLEAALVGLEYQKKTIEAHIAELRSRIVRRVGRPRKGVATPDIGPFVAIPKKKRFMSADARKRIADAQKKRWAGARKAERQA